MARPIWKGSISFSLINIPVMLMSAKEDAGIRFRMLDKKDHSPIGYKNYNKNTGEEVSRDRIVKGYEYEPENFVIITDDDLKNANIKATQTIDIQDFVSLSDIDLLYFEKPYYLAPVKNAEKGYVLLRDTLLKTKKAAIAKIVMHNKQRLVAIYPVKNFLLLETLRYAHEIRDITEVEFTDPKLERGRISPQELHMTEKLVEGMTNGWKPEKYKDTYYDDLMIWIDKKVKQGKTTQVKAVKSAESLKGATATNVVDLMPLLRKSLASTPAPKRKRRA